MDPLLRRRLEALAPYALLTIATLAARVYAFGLPATPPESLHYAVAREFGRSDPDITGLIWWFQFLLRPHLWARPAFAASLWLPAQWSFEATRVVSLAVTSLLPLLLAVALRRLGAARSVSIAVGLVAALHPAFVMGSVRLDPIQWMCVGLLGSLCASEARRPGLAAALLAFAIGCDRLAIPGGVALLLHAAAGAHRAGTFRLWPLRAPPEVAGILLVLAMAPLPLVYSALHTWGLYGSPAPLRLVAESFLGPWLLVAVIPGLAFARTRRWSVFAFGYPLLFLLSLWLLGRTATPQQALVSVVFALLAAGLGVDELVRASARPGPRTLARGAGAAIVALLLLPAFTSLPVGVDPLQTPDLSTQVRLGELGATWTVAAGWLQGAPRVMLVDAPLESLYHPFHDAAPDAPLQFVFSSSLENLSLWADALEQNETRTLIVDNDAPLNRAVREVYADCVTERAGGFTLIVGGACHGRAEALYQQMLRNHGHTWPAASAGSAGFLS